MIENSEDFMLQQSLREVEKHLGWGPSDRWTTQDFADLSEKIHHKTGVVLSVTTLKRLWGKVNYKSKPTTATLNALVQYIGYENWQSFKQSHASILKYDNPIKLEAEEKLAKRNYLGIALTVTTVVALLTTGFLLADFSFETSNVLQEETGKGYSFSSKMMVSEGVPNSVIFNYDATAATSTDTIYIQQSWDERLRERVLRQEKIHSTIYYHPGFFQAKLVVNGEIVKEQDLFIKTNGWLALAEQEGGPVYFGTKEVFNVGNSLHLPLHRLKESNMPLQPKTPWVSYYNVREFSGLKTDNFVFQTEVKNDYNEGSAVCQHTEIHVLFQGGAFVVPLSIKGCVSELMLYDINGRKEDSSALGCNLSDWVKVTYRVRNKMGRLYINEVLAYDSLDFNLPTRAIIGLRYRFQGTGSVKSIRFANGNGEVVYEENFGK